jgi:anti-sigma factor RsiW
MSDAASRLSEAELAELCALADGTLPADRRSAVEARVAASPELQVLLERQRLAVAAADALPSEPVPASLREAIEAERRPRRARQARPPRWLVPRIAVATALAAAIAVVASVVLTNNPAAPTVAEAARFAAEAPSGPPPRSTGDGIRLAVDVDGVVFPDLSSYGWRAVSMHRGEVDGRDATTVVYEKGGKRIAYGVVEGSGLARPSAAQGTTREGVLFQTLRVDGRFAVTWRRLGNTCVLVGTAPQSELLTLASWRGEGALPY